MFEVGFSELCLIGVVALVVLGPERLPALAQKVGLWAGYLQHYLQRVKEDISKDVDLAELQRIQSHVHDLRQQIETTVHSGVRQFSDTLTPSRGEDTPSESSTSKVELPATTPHDLPRPFACPEKKVFRHRPLHPPAITAKRAIRLQLRHFTSSWVKKRRSTQ